MIDADDDLIDEATDPVIRLATDICLAAIEAVKDGEIGAESFFYSRRGENILLGLGIDPDLISGHLMEKYKMAETTLTRIAADLKNQAIATPHQPVSASLNGGLRLKLIYRFSHWTLSVMRPNNKPSEAELAAVFSAFAIPEDVKVEYEDSVFNGVKVFVRKWRWPGLTQFNFVFQEDRVVAYYNEAK